MSRADAIVHRRRQSTSIMGGDCEASQMPSAPFPPWPFESSWSSLCIVPTSLVVQTYTANPSRTTTSNKRAKAALDGVVQPQNGEVRPAKSAQTLESDRLPAAPNRAL